MLNGITWTEYFVGMAVLMIAYYAYVLMRYYPQELKNLLSSGRNQQIGHLAPSEMFIQDEGYLDDPEDDTNEYDVVGHADQDDEFMDVEELINSITDVIEKASKTGMVVGEFKQFLRMVLREKPNVKDSPFRPSINDLIVSECEKYETYTLSVKEVDGLWDT